MDMIATYETPHLNVQLKKIKGLEVEALTRSQNGDLPSALKGTKSRTLILAPSSSREAEAVKNKAPSHYTIVILGNLPNQGWSGGDLDAPFTLGELSDALQKAGGEGFLSLPSAGQRFVIEGAVDEDNVWSADENQEEALSETVTSAREWAKPEPLAPQEGSFSKAHNKFGHVIAITSPKGGVGKSNLSVNLGAVLASALAKQGRRVCLLDANTHQADGSTLTGRRREVATIATIMKAGRINEHNVRLALTHYDEKDNKGFGGLYILHGIDYKTNVKEAGDVRPVTYVAILEVLKKIFDYIIIDTPAVQSEHELFDEAIVPMADKVVVIVTSENTTLNNVEEWLQTSTRPRANGGYGLRKDNVYLLGNNVNTSGVNTAASLESRFSGQNWLGSIPHNKKWPVAANQNKVIAAEDPEIKKNVSDILFALTQEPSVKMTEVEKQPSLAQKLLKMVKR